MATRDHSLATTIHKGAYRQSADPGAVGSGVLWVDTTTGPPYVLKVRNAADSGWEDVGSVGGGGAASLAQSYVGYDVIGGSQETPSSALKQYFKQITLAADAVLLTVEAYITQAADAAFGPFACGVYSDDSGTPGILLGANSVPTASTAQAVLEQFPGPAWTPRWLALPVGVFLPAGTYWIMFAPGGEHIYYDATGSDNTQIPSGAVAGDYLNTGSWSPAVSSNEYSIRANIVAAASPDSSWTDATLAGTWTSNTTSAAYPNVGYRKDSSGVVHLRGMATGGGAALIFTLPADYRPDHDLWLTAQSGGGVLGVFVKASDGTVSVAVNADGTGGSGQTNMRLDGLSFWAA